MNIENDIELVTLSGAETYALCNGLADVLIACVHGGASVSFMAPLNRDAAICFWHAVAESVERKERLVIAARERAEARILGTVQIVLKQPENQPHRGDLAKMLVTPGARCRGIGTRLLSFAEDAARAAGKTLLVLDTATGGDAERLYQRSGWTRVGTIPDYALLPDGLPCGTTIFYKRL